MIPCKRQHIKVMCGLFKSVFSRDPSPNEGKQVHGNSPAEDVIPQAYLTATLNKETAAGLALSGLWGDSGCYFRTLP